MFIPLIFSTSVLVGLHYWGHAETVYQWMVKQPLQYYIWFLLFISVIQLLIWIYRKVFPHIVGFYRSMSRITSRIDNLSNTIDRSSEKGSNSPFKNGSRRSFSSKSLKTSSFNHPSKGRGNTEETKLSRMLSSRRIKGLFASIVENEAMVSLDRKFIVVRDKFSTMDEVSLYLKTHHSKDTEFKVVERKAKDGSTFLQLSTLQRGSLSDLILGYGWRVIAACFPNKVKFASRIKLLRLFSGYIYQMYRHHGSTQVVKYLKASQLAIQKAVGGDKVDNLRLLDKDVIRSKVTKTGLPVFIPSRDRKLIMAEQLNPAIIRYYLTLFSLYRVISIPGTLKLETIVNPPSPGSNYSEVVRNFSDILSQSRFSSMFRLSTLAKEQSPLLLEAASSSHKVAWFGLFSNPAMLDYLGLGGYARNLLNLMGQYKLRLLFDSCSTLYPFEGLEFYKGASDSPLSHSDIGNPEGRFGGKLSIKEEAAGKMRVFAMVDVWTQSILKPIEKMLANFLRNLPNDGVYDQHSSELRARSKALLAGCSYGYDLSAATDRLPLSLQSTLLDQLVPELGANWALFLTKRDYYMYLPDSFAKELGATPNTFRAQAPNALDIGSTEIGIRYNEKSQPWIALRYSTGQPMGALSSFAMLAVTHHMIAQLAYRLAYNVPMSLPFTKDTWYTGYECTGDDIILFDGQVANRYLYIMEALGVPVNTMKSVVATKPVTEYLKCTSAYGLSVGAISWKKFMSTGNTMMGRANIINSILSKGIIKDNINRYIASVARLSLYKPGNLNPTLIALWTIAANTGIITLEECLKALINGKKAIFHFAKTILYNADVNKITGLLPSIYKKLPFTIETSKAARHVWNFEAPWFKITLWKPLAVFQYRHDVTTDSLKLTSDIFEYLNSNLPTPMEEITNPLLIEGPTEFSPHLPVLDETQLLINDYKVLFQFVLGFITEKLEKIGGPLFEEPAQMDSPFEVIYHHRQEMDRYNELLELVSRAKIKIDPDQDAPPARVVKPSDLKLVSLLRRTGDRPLFTTANSMSARANFPFKFT
ncbi:putative RNA-dependent RNA polymerase [Rhizoctonia solani mitovirus 21]|uniref:RNA-dependent RNA polymerase n=1 Tax=Rhizoctonia solani mitovirus 21 TaxID=2599414 RepID=A0ABX5Y8Q6_9VIRU|nr:putative RNA-dependent RNA polymerase [Rhizoctonia solani mitovirus 21]QDW65413.1 putative RNA-dependent RNA polymerase [Rhizoctonia solani mitovirus 21]